MTPPPPLDQAARDTIAADHDRTLFVEAGAGTGKTTALVARVVALVTEGRLTSMAQLAAISFTENAAAELRERIRLALAGTDHPACEAALRTLDDAAITTLHGLAARLLADFPLEAGLPPGFAVAEGVSAQIRSREAWTAFMDDLLDDETVADHVLAGLALGLRLVDLREVALTLEGSWDQLHPGTFTARPLPTVEIGALLAPLREALAFRGRGPAGDSLSSYLEEQLPAVVDGLAALSEPAEVLEALAALRLPKRLGSAPAWTKAGLDKGTVADLLLAADSAAAQVVADVGDAVTQTLCARVADHVLREVEQRRLDGVLAFHDLLVRARDLLRDDAGVRARVRARLPFLLVDEFQDTDPLQVELAHLIAGDHGEGAAEPWAGVAVEGGRLFFVGDPKQSIYRFRRADVELYTAVGDRHAEGRTSLAVNFRSVPGVLDIVNHVFGQLLGASTPGQVAHADLLPSRAATPDVPTPVTLLGGPVDLPAPALRAAEAEQVAATILRVRAEKWQVGDGDGTRDARYGDVAVLLPTRTSLPALEAALLAADVPYRIESRSLVWATDAVRDLVTLLQAVDDPADEVATVAALRHHGLACSDVHLTEWAAAGGRWNYLAPPPEGAPAGSPVAAGMATLRELHDLRWWLPVHELVARVVTDLRLVELTAALHRPRDHWRRLRFVVDQARAFADAGGSGLSGFVAWAVEQIESEADVKEVAVPEPDDDAVRVLTVHGSKGLEFPVTVVAGLGVAPKPRGNVVWTVGGAETRLKAGTLQTAGWDVAWQRDAALEQAEAVRLLYVAMTRARDHLVLGCHHKPAKGPKAQGSHTQRLWALLGDRIDLAMPAPGASVSSEVSGTEQVAWPLDVDRGVVVEERAELVTAIASRVATSPTAMVALAAAAGDDKEPQRAEPAPKPAPIADDARVADPGVPAPRRPAFRRSGTQGAAIGTAVHWVLEHVSLVDRQSNEVHALAVATCVASRIPELEHDVASRVESVLRDEGLRQAALNGRIRREVYVVARQGERFVEGYIDALLEDPEDGRTVVDFKTDRARTDAELAAKEAHYAPQLQSYQSMLAAAGVEIPAARLLFARP